MRAVCDGEGRGQLGGGRLLVHVGPLRGERYEIWRGGAGGGEGKCGALGWEEGRAWGFQYWEGGIGTGREREGGREVEGMERWRRRGRGQVGRRARLKGR